MSENALQLYLVIMIEENVRITLISVIDDLFSQLLA